MNLIIALLLSVSVSWAKPLKIGIIDSGLIPNKVGYRLCQKVPSKNFVLNEEVINENNLSHGTNILSLIKNVLEEESVSQNYCFVMYKAFSYVRDRSTEKSSFLRALDAAIKDNVDVLNISAGGLKPDIRETALIKKALDKGIIIIAAAGNDEIDFDKDGCNYYPACVDKRILILGNIAQNGRELMKYSNSSGKITNFVAATGSSRCAGGYCYSGTSQATAIMTAEIAKLLLLREKHGQ